MSEEPRRVVRVPAKGTPPNRQDPPAQVPTSYLYEEKSSREIDMDLQRKTIVHRYLIRGTPDVAILDSATKEFQPARPHVWFPSKLPGDDTKDSPAYVTKLSIRHQGWGLNPVPGEDGTAGGLKDQGEAQAWAILTVWYVQRPCPRSYEESYTVSLGSFPEWYTLPLSEEEYGNLPPGKTADDFIPVALTGSIQPVPILRPVPVYKRRWIKVYLTPQGVKTIRREAGKLNGIQFLGEGVGFWMLDGVNIRHLHGILQANTVAAYEVIAVWRGDPLRKHRFVTYKTAAVGFRPMVPEVGQNTIWTYEALHRFGRLYSNSQNDWDALVPDRAPDDEEWCVPQRLTGQ